MADERTTDEFEMDEETAERLIGLNELIEELMRDASSLSKDLIEGIGAIGGAAAIMFTIVTIEALLLIVNLWRGPLFIAVFLLFGILPMIFFGTRMLLKFFELRRKYQRIYEINRELEM